MHIKKHVQWSNRAHMLVEFSSSENSSNNAETERVQSDQTKKPKIANHALVFVVCAINASFQLPITYYFINSMDGHKKKCLVEIFLEELIDCNIILSSVTFDGFQTNKTMCNLFGAELNVYSPHFRPYFVIKSQRIYIFFDACHMIKLISQ